MTAFCYSATAVTALPHSREYFMLIPSARNMSLLVLALAMGCGGDKTADDTGGGGGDTSGTPSGDFQSVSARLSTGVATVVIVDFAIDGTASDAWVEYGADESYGGRAPVRSDNPNESLILGLTADTPIHFRVGATVDGTTHYSDDETITTGSLPDGFMSYSIDPIVPDAPWGSYMLTTIYNTGEGVSNLIIMNQAGEKVWYLPPVEGFVPAARFSADGEAILYILYPSVFDSESAKIYRMSLDGETTSSVDAPYCHHDFVEMPDGSYTCLQETFRTIDNWDLVGDKLTNITLDGTMTTLWDAFEEITPVETPDWPNQITPEGVDWTHANGMWFDEASDAYYVSFYHFMEVRKLTATNTHTEWILGGEDSDFSFAGPRFGPQHAPMIVGGNVYVFSNSDQTEESSVMGYSLDEGAHRATNILQYFNPDHRHANVMGDADLLENGYMLSAWGDVGQIVVYDPDGAPVWHLTTDMPAVTCQTYAKANLYR